MWLDEKFKTQRLHLTFDDVSIVPALSDVESRIRDVNISTSLPSPHSTLSFATPYVSANMDSVSGPEMIAAMWRAGGLGILYRVEDDVNNSLDMIEQVAKLDVPLYGFGIAVGSNWTNFDFGWLAGVIKKNFKDPSPLICLDVAHAHSKKVERVLKGMRDIFETEKLTPTVIAGNISTAEGARWLVSQGVHGVKVGQGNGSNCSTRVMTGCGVPQLSAILEVAEFRASSSSIFGIIADGGIRAPGDVSKAIAAGADAVMIGRLFAGTDEAPGSIFNDDLSKKRFKIYRGGASLDFKLSHKMEARNVEGVASLVECQGPVANVINYLSDGLRSAMSYAGCKTIKEFQEEATFIRVSTSSYIEGTPHGLKK